MADTKISALTGATTPLAGTEVVPVVQSGTTKNVSVANLTAGRAVSATGLTLTTDNLVIGTSGKGIAGTTTNDSADAGVVGEFVSSTILQANRVGLTTGTPVDITSISLTAGDWDVTGLLGLSENSSTSWTYYIGSFSTTSNTISTLQTNSITGYIDSATLAVTNVFITMPTIRVSLSGTTTYYFVGQGSFSGGSGQAAFGTISARRVR